MTTTNGVPLRIITTNDIFGGFFPVPTSYGHLPGGHALAATVDRLRDQAGAAYWIDAGDFSGGGPLAPASRATQSWAAADTLGIDMAVPGNHEFDYADEAFAALAGKHSLPLMSTDLRDHASVSSRPGLDIAASTVLEAAGLPPVAVLGLTFPERRGLDVYDVPADHDRGVGRVREAATRLRADGAGCVVLVMHEGVPAAPSPADSAVGGQFSRIRTLCGALRDAVDVIIGGHTCAHHLGDIDGMPFLQPWSYGAEVGLLDIDSQGIHLGTVSVRSRDSRPWTGPGTALYQQLSSEIVGQLQRPLATPATPDTGDLRDAVASGLVRLAAADVALVHASDVGCVQPAVDGCFAYLPSGSVTEADVLRILPWAVGDFGDAVYTAALTGSEVDALIAGFTSEDGLRPGLARRGSGGMTLVARNYLDKARRLLGRDHDWQPAGIGQRDGLRHYLTHPTCQQA